MEPTTHSRKNDKGKRGVSRKNAKQLGKVYEGKRGNKLPKKSCKKIQMKYKKNLVFEILFSDLQSLT